MRFTDLFVRRPVLAVVVNLRDLLQAQVNLLQATLDHQSSRVTFEALQLVPPPNAGETIGVRGADIVLLPTSARRGVFRQGAGVGLPQ